MKIVATGFPRGGTSALAGTIHLMGIPFVYDNPLNVEFGKLSHLLVNRNYREGGKLIKQFFTDVPGPLGWKYPVFCRDYEGIKSYLPSNIKVIIISRDYYSAAMSHVNRMKTPFFNALDWYSRSLSFTIDFVKKFKGDILFVTFCELRHETETTIDKIANFCNIKVDNKRRTIIKEYLSVKNYKNIRIFEQKI